jgi:hypothetical protein
MKRLSQILILILTCGLNSTYASQVFTFSELKKVSNETNSQDSVNLSANFNLNQLDSDLKPYFSPVDGSSQLCAPVTLAQFILYNMAITKKLPITRKVPGVSTNLKKIDASKLIVAVAKKCKTDFTNGTYKAPLMDCLGDIFSTYFDKTISVKQIEASQDVFPHYVDLENKAPRLSDITASLKKGQPLMTFLGLGSYDPIGRRWMISSGHFVGIYGFSAKTYAENNKMQLMVANPLAMKTKESFDTLTTANQDLDTDVLFSAKDIRFNGASTSDKAIIKFLTVISID